MNDLIVAEKIAQWQKLKALVLDSVSSPNGMLTSRYFLPGSISSVVSRPSAFSLWSASHRRSPPLFHPHS
jgi:hypothetical protein